jgi:MYXO-CTERM domain-containing protein
MTFSAADQQQLLVGFGPCMRDNFAWAMDPYTSCEAPGCSDPYAGYPLTWTFKESATDLDPAFVRPTRSYMPACNMTSGSNSCVGEIPNTFTGEGLELARSVIADYKTAPAPFHADDATRYVNILISDGQTSEGSSDVQAPLAAMAAEGIDTYVIGFGTSADLDEAQLNQYAAWGQTGSAIIVDPTSAGGATALADALEGVVREIELDACCVLNACGETPEPPDPEPVCGDGRVEGDEVCDDGRDNATYDHCGARCDGPHLYCGDSRRDGPERCDDGNEDDGDGCSECQIEDDDGGMMEGPSAGGLGGMQSSPSGGAGGSAGAGVSVPPWRDAGSDSDAGEPKPNKAGCACSVPGPRSRAPRALWLAVMLAVSVIGRRRRST